jgi:hypothetical protein
MRRIVIFTLLCTAGMFQLHAQDTDTLSTPDEQTIVNKKFDENGNLIQYDSTYVHRWSSDSTFNMPFDENSAFGRNLQEYLNNFMNDSLMANFGFRHDFSPLGDDDFMNPLNPSIPDSVFMKQFHMNQDSLYHFHFNFDQFPQEFDSPDMQALHKQLQEELNRKGYEFPEFRSKEQQEEWEQLMKKHQAEKEELLKKWEKENKDKLY